jgi:inorganic triphosphatase YgiF
MTKNIFIPSAGLPQLNRSIQKIKELELKFIGPKNAIVNIFDNILLPSPLHKLPVQNLHTIYFDTDDYALFRSWITLRTRLSDHQKVMTLKWSTPSDDIFSRGEIELPISQEKPDFDEFEPKIAEALNGIIGLAPLIKIFEMTVNRRPATCRIGGSLIEIAVDQGKIIAGNQTEGILECELELKEGDMADLLKLGIKLVRAGLYLSPIQKAQRGYQLARQMAPQEMKAMEPQFESDTTAEEAMFAIIELCIRHFVGNWSALLIGNHEESVHQARVALRRLRTALKILEKSFSGMQMQSFRDEAKEIAIILGDVRNLDVFNTFIKNESLKKYSSDESFKSLEVVLMNRRNSAYEAARELIKSANTSCFILELQEYIASKRWHSTVSAEVLEELSGSAKSFARMTLEQQYKRVKKAGKNFGALTSEERHQLRISVKNLRYSCDFFSSLFTDSHRIKSFRKTLASLQDSLGLHNDAAMAAIVASDLETSAVPEASRAIGIVIGWCAHETLSPDSEIAWQWHDFKQKKRFW